MCVLSALINCGTVSMRLIVISNAFHNQKVRSDYSRNCGNYEMPPIIIKGYKSIQNDLTKKEREEEKKLLDEARANEALDGGKTRFRVRGPPWARRIVRMKPHGDE